MNPTTNDKGNILVVDDTPENLRLLVGLLKGKGYEVRPVPSGELALSGAQYIPPDLILLDIMMPKMDGYEVCIQLKADERTKDIPVIFISAINEVLDKVKAFEVGGVDYITKPFQVEEVLARVETHLALRSLQKSFQQKNEDLAKTLDQLKITHNQLRQANEQMQQEVAQRKQAEEKLQQANDKLEEQVKARTLELTQANAQLAVSNQELQQALNHLKATQAELIQSEKMAVLGQLVAGVGHEINTPLALLRSSVQEIANFLTQELEQLPAFFQYLSKELQPAFFALLQKSLQQTNYLSSREHRQFRKTLQRQLELHSIENADGIASMLVDIGLWDEIEPFLPLLKAPNSKKILETVYELASLQRNTRNIATATDQAAKVVLALKKYAHYDFSGEKVPANITEGIETVLTLYHSKIKHGVEVIRNYQSSLPSILCYPDELNQVWTNLIQNALQVMDYKGTLRIDVTRQDLNLLVCITDSGKGIPPEIMPRIFEPFFTTKPVGEGSGLGLDIVKKIIEKHQGKISVESVPGKTTFTVFLPINLN